MSFRLGDIVVKDIVYGIASDIVTGDPLYVLTQLNEASINITADSIDVTDKNGTIVMRQYRGKTGEFTATNAFINMNVLAAAGADTHIASVGNALVAPKVIKVPKTQVAAVLSDVVSGSIKVVQYFGDGNLGKKYELGLTPSDTEYTITNGSTTVYAFPDVTAGYVTAENQAAFPEIGEATKKYIAKDTGKVYGWDSTSEPAAYVEDTTVTAEVVAVLPSTGTEDKLYVVTADNTVHSCVVTVTPNGTTTVTLPTDPEADYFMITYRRSFTEGAVITNSANKFPESVNMLLKVSYYNLCSKSEVKAAYVEMPSFKVSPETTLSFNPDSPTMDFNGTLEVDYCSDNKELFSIYQVDEIDNM